MDEETIRIYDARAADYRERAKGAPDDLLKEFIATIPQGGLVLDLGCGPGHCAAAMAEAGLKVDAWDASAEMSALAEQVPGVSARQARFGDLADENQYDGIWASFSLLHAPRSDLPGHLRAIHKALKPGGQFHMAIKTGTGEGRDKLGRFYCYYSEDDLTGLLRDAGFTPTKITTGRGKGLDEAPMDWISVASHA